MHRSKSCAKEAIGEGRQQDVTVCCIVSCKNGLFEGMPACVLGVVK